MSRLALAAVLCGLWAAAPVAAQIHGVHGVIRRADDRGLVLLVEPRVRREADLGQPTDVTGFTLIDLGEGGRIPLRPRSRVELAGCPFPRAEDVPAPQDRVCLELEDGARLERDRSYVLVARKTGLSPAASDTLGAGIQVIGPVGGAVEKPTGGLGDVVVASYSLDLSGAEVDPRILLNGEPVPIDTVLNPRVAGLPLCYVRGSGRFHCRIRRGIRNGDRVAVQLVRRGTAEPDPALPGIEPAVAEVGVPETPDEAALYVRGGFTRLNGSQEGAVEFTLRELPGLPFTRWTRAAGPVLLRVNPFVDVSLTTSDPAEGKLDFGGQLSMDVHKPLPLLRLVEMRVTPRRESDQDNETANWMYADAEVRLYVDPLHTGRVLKRGTYSVVPRFGYERGVTDRGGDVPRLEANDPSRWMAGVSAALTWPAGWLLPGMVRLSTDWESHRIRLRTGGGDRMQQRWLLQGTVEVSRNFGVSITRRKGRSAPSFVDQSTLEVGATYLR